MFHYEIQKNIVTNIVDNIFIFDSIGYYFKTLHKLPQNLKSIIFVDSNKMVTTSFSIQFRTLKEL